MSAEDAPATTLAAVVRLAIAATCRRYVGRCAEAVARAQGAGIPVRERPKRELDRLAGDAQHQGGQQRDRLARRQHHLACQRDHAFFIRRHLHPLVFVPSFTSH